MFRTFRCRCLHWVFCSKPFPWRRRSPDRWPLCRCCSCKPKRRLILTPQDQSSPHPINWHLVIRLFVTTLTFECQIRSACRAGSVWQRKMKSTSGQNLAFEDLKRAWIINGSSVCCREILQKKKSFFVVHTWGVWNNLSSVLRTPTGAVAGVGSQAPWNHFF